MFEQDSLSYYQLLDLSADASQQEIIEAYNRAKSAFRRDAVATYGIFEADESQGILEKIEYAYEVLSNIERRREYDERMGFMTAKKLQTLHPAAGRVKQQGTAGSFSSPSNPFVRNPNSTTQSNENPSGKTSVLNIVQSTKTQQDARTQASHPTHDLMSTSKSLNSENIAAEIDNERDWSGSFLKHIREARGLSVEDVAAQTKISKNYINAIEEEEFKKLPATVFVRGFLVQIAKTLKIPADKVTQAYLDRIKK